MAEEEIGLRIALRDRRTAAQGLQETKGDIDELGDAAETAGKKAEASGRRWDKLRGAVGLVGRGVMYGVTAVGALGAAAAATGLKTAASMETARIGFTTMLGSARKARVFLGDLANFAAKTPFEFPDLQTAASSLISVGIDSKKVIPIMKTLGNVTAGMGTGSEGIQRATVALQQMTAAQRVSGEDLNQLRDAGIPVYDLLASALGKTKQEVVELAGKGKLGADALAAMMKALETGKGLERFNGLMEKQSASLSGVWSTLSDTVQMGLAKAIQPALPMVKDLVLAASDLAAGAMPKLRDGIKSFVGWIQRLVDAYKAGGIKGIFASLRGDGAAGASAFGRALGGIGAAIAGVDWGKLKDAAIEKFGPALSNIGGALADIDWTKLGGSLISSVTGALGLFADGLQLAADHSDLLAKAIPVLVAGFLAYKAAQAANNVIGKDSLVGFALQIAQQLALRKSVNSLAVAFERMAAAQVGAAGAAAASTAAGGANTAATTANTAAQGANTTATNAGVLATIRARAAAVASAVATGAMTVATGAWTAAQWLLNAALTANPIGLVIVGIGLLIGAFVLAYKKVDWFRNGVNAALGGVLAAGKFVWNWIKANWPLLLAILTGPFGIAVYVIAKNWDRIKAGAGAAKDFVVERFNQLVGFFKALPGRIGGVFSGLFDGLKSAFRSAINFIIGGWNSLQFSIPGFDPPGPGPKFGGMTIGVPQIPLLAQGGRVAPGMPYIVGDGGREELFVPDTSGTVLPRVPKPSQPTPWSEADIDSHVLTDDTDVRVGPSHPGGPITVQLVVDRQVLGEVVLDDFDDRAARR